MDRRAPSPLPSPRRSRLARAVGWAELLELLLPDRTTTPRRFFIFATTLLLQQIVFRTKKIETQRRTPPEDFVLMNAKS